MKDAGTVFVQQFQGMPGQVRCIGGTPDLIMNDVQLLPGSGQGQDALDEIGLARPEQPGCAQDQQAVQAEFQKSFLSFEFGASVYREGIGFIPGQIRGFFLPLNTKSVL